MRLKSNKIFSTYYYGKETGLFSIPVTMIFVAAKHSVNENVGNLELTFLSKKRASKIVKTENAVWLVFKL